MDKRTVASALERIAAYLELKGDNPFRVRAFQNASRIIAHLGGDLKTALANGELARIEGIGKATVEIVTDLVTKGTSPVLAELEAETPRGLLEMMKISGLGVAKIRLIHEKLGIDNLDDLEKAAVDGRLTNLPRFGKKTAENILRGIGYLRRAKEYRLFHHARSEAGALAAALEAMEGVKRAHIAGEIRRRCDVVADLAFVLDIESNRDEVTAALDSIPEVIEFHTASPRIVTLKFGSGAAADLTLSETMLLGYDLIRATGSAGHFHALRSTALDRGITFTDDGPTRDGEALPCPDERTVYSMLGLQFIPPELREGTGEIELAAAGTIPDLVAREDLRGFLHCHTNFSDGSNTVSEWAKECLNAGYEYLGITDHSIAATYAGGLAADDIGRQHEEVDEANRQLGGIRVLKGVEADILADGSIDYTPEVRARFDFIIASVHNRFNNSREEMTARILSAMDDPHVCILGHPTGRMLLSRDPYPMDVEAVFDRAAELGVAVEINSDPQRLDLDWTNVRKALDHGVTVSIGADAHSSAGMNNVELGVGVARKGMVTRDRVLNALPADDFLAFARARR